MNLTRLCFLSALLGSVAALSAAPQTRVRTHKVEKDTGNRTVEVHDRGVIEDQHSDPDHELPSLMQSQDEHSYGFRRRGPPKVLSTGPAVPPKLVNDHATPSTGCIKDGGDCSYIYDLGTQECHNKYPDGEEITKDNYDKKFGKLCIVDPCVWGEWQDWSECTYTCGSSIFAEQERTRDADDPHEGGEPCVGPMQETKSCNTEACPTTTASYNSTLKPIKISNEAAGTFFLMLIILIYWPFILCFCCLCMCCVIFIVMQSNKSKHEHPTNSMMQQDWDEPY